MQSSLEHSIAALHTETDSDVFSVVACHSLNLINEVILMESADSLPLVHFMMQSLMQECASAAANVLLVDISAALVKLKLDRLHLECLTHFLVYNLAISQYVDYIKEHYEQSRVH